MKWSGCDGGNLRFVPTYHQYAEALVREFYTPATYVVPPTGSLSDDVVRNAAEAPDAAVLSRPGADGSWDDVTSS